MPCVIINTHARTHTMNFTRKLGSKQTNKHTHTHTTFPKFTSVITKFILRWGIYIQKVNTSQISIYHIKPYSPRNWILLNTGEIPIHVKRSGPKWKPSLSFPYTIYHHLMVVPLLCHPISISARIYYTDFLSTFSNKLNVEILTFQILNLLYIFCCFH
jgi:hypothetical protein